MRRDPREPEREALGAAITRRTGRLAAVALTAASLVLVVALIVARLG